MESIYTKKAPKGVLKTTTHTILVPVLLSGLDKHIGAHCSTCSQGQEKLTSSTSDIVVERDVTVSSIRGPYYGFKCNAFGGQPKFRAQICNYVKMIKILTQI